MSFERFWYIVAESRELRPRTVLARQILDEWLVCYRSADGQPVVLRDRCLHRSARLSRGRVEGGRLTCPYHGWVYDGTGRVVSIPSVAPAVLERQRYCARRYPVRELDGYVYVRLVDGDGDAIEPFRMPHYREPGWKTIRLQNRFRNTVSNCVENFIDIPHTVFVHRGIFRSRRNDKITARISRRAGEVHVNYHNERGNLGTFAWFLNPRGHEIQHTDSFYMPNITCVRYTLGPRKCFIITSQSVPVADAETLVYTDLTYNFGPWNAGAAWFVRRQGQRIIDQDLRVLDEQMTVIQKYGGRFIDTPADLIHRFVDSIREAIARGEDPRRLPESSTEIEFLV